MESRVYSWMPYEPNHTYSLLEDLENKNNKREVVWNRYNIKLIGEHKLDIKSYYREPSFVVR